MEYSLPVADPAIIAMPAVDPSAGLEPLVQNYRSYFYYPNVRSVSRSHTQLLLNAGIRNLLAKSGILVKVDAKNFAFLVKRQFDSDFYSRDIWRMDSIFAESAEALDSILISVSAVALANGIDFLTIDFGTLPISFSKVLTTHGYYFAESKTTFIFYCAHYSDTDLGKPLYKVRKASTADIESLKQLSTEVRLETTLGSDPYFQDQAAKLSSDSAQLYSTWIEKAVTGEWANCAYVAQNSRGIVGFTCFRFDTLFNEVVEQQITDCSGLAFVSPKGTGAYVALMDAVPRLEPNCLGYLIEGRTSNLAVQRYCSARGFDILGTRQIFHRAFRD